MARDSNPLQRDRIGVSATLPTARLQGPSTNAALQLAEALKDATPEAQAALQGYAQEEADKQRARAKQDALIREGQPLADAVREGKIDATQNPWYMQAYNRESASLRSLDSLQKLQTDSSSWESYNDPDKFAADWHKAVAEQAQSYTDKDSQLGFQAAQQQVTSQVLQENVARNIARIKTERVDNLGALMTDSFQSAFRQSGGTLSPNTAYQTLGPAREQWFATGGDLHTWQQLVVKAVTSSAYAQQDSSILDILKAPELMHGPSEAGNLPVGQGSRDASSLAQPHALLKVDPDVAATLARPQGMVTAGNLPTGIRYRVKNPDGSVSTVRTISIGTDAGEVLIPTVVDNKVVSNEEAIAHYKQTGENFGTFATVEAADKYAEALHKSHEEQLAPKVQVHAPATKLAPPVTGFGVTSNFGARSAPKAGASTNHRGVDLGTPVGTPVQAQATGKVLSAHDEGKLGNTVRVDYGNGVVGVYGHLSSIAVSPGDIVAGGQQLAKTGASGNVTGPHLHYQLMVNGKATNPLTYKGTVGGGTFEADQAAESTPTQPGFPTGPDQPFKADGVLPGNVLNRGPSLYGLPGVADQVESDRYRINEAAAAAPLQRARVIKAQREARGYEASDVLWQRYGSGLLTGHVTKEMILKDLGGQYSGPEIAEAMQQVNSVLRDSVGVGNAQVAARGQNPGDAMDTLDIVSDAQRNGWTPALHQRIGNKVLSGDISGDDARQLEAMAVSRSNQQQSEQRAEAREQRAADTAAGGVHNYTAARRAATYLRDSVVEALVRVKPLREGTYRSPKKSKAMLDKITSAQGAWLNAHPDDWDGALQAGKDAANKLLLQEMGQPSGASKPAATGGGNPLRGN